MPHSQSVTLIHESGRNGHFDKFYIYQGYFEWFCKTREQNEKLCTVQEAFMKLYFLSKKKKKGKTSRYACAA